MEHGYLEKHSLTLDLNNPRVFQELQIPTGYS